MKMSVFYVNTGKIDANNIPGIILNMNDDGF